MSLIKNSQFRVWILLFFFLSGATGIIYEVVWSRLLTRVMGNTNFSIATVLTAFMGGLALGSYLGGGFIDRKNNPLAVYAWLEGAVGLYCLLIPFLIDAAFPLFQSIYLNFPHAYMEASFLRFLICGTILIIPTSFMGATLPVLSKLVTSDSAFIGREVGTLYAINTFGAVLGAWSSAFVLMRYLGIWGTIYSTAFANLAIAGTILLFFKSHHRQAPPAAREIPVVEGEDIGTGRTALVLFCFGLSGLSALVYQVAWTRIFSLLLGSSVYAFSLILTTFILGLALGTTVFARLSHFFRDPLKAFGLTQTGIGLSALAALPLFGQVPFVNRWVYQNLGQDFALVQGVNFFVILGLLIVPTFLMGAQFPLVVKLVARHLARVGRHVGRAYAANTLGTIFGSFFAGFVFIPWLGIQNTILCAVFLNVAVGILVLSFSPALTTNLKVYVLPLVGVLYLWAGNSIPPWDKAVISSGSFMPYRIEELQQAVLKKNKILFYKEGIHTTVTTELSLSGNIFLRVNGKTDASLGLDMGTQLLSGYLPLFFNRGAREALVIGQGSGITLGAVEQFPVERIDLVEISPAVIEGSRFFSPFNHHALDDPRVNLVLEDGRNHLALTDRTYDIIISEPSNPWISGVGALFTRDFFQLAMNRLNPGGIVCVWVHTNMSPMNFESVLKTFSAVFPHATMWESIVGEDYLLIGAREPHYLPYEATETFLTERATGEDLWRIGIKNVSGLMSLMMMNRQGMVRFSEGAPLHTDDNSLLEFDAPEYIYKDQRRVIVRKLDPFVKVDPSILRFSRLPGEDRARIRKKMSALNRSQSQMEEVRRRLNIDRTLDRAKEAFDAEDLDRAERLYLEILNLDPRNILTLYDLGNIYTLEGRTGQAETVYKKTLRINPFYLFGYIALAKVYISTQRPAQAAELLRGVLKWHGRDAEIHLHLGVAYSFLNQVGSAIGEWNRALEINPEFSLPHYFLGVQYQKSEPDLSREHLLEFLRLAGPRQATGQLAANARKLLKKF